MTMRWQRAVVIGAVESALQFAVQKGVATRWPERRGRHTVARAQRPRVRAWCEYCSACTGRCVGHESLIKKMTTWAEKQGEFRHRRFLLLRSTFWCLLVLCTRAAAKSNEYRIA
jgi:hypothetical protein